MLTALVLICSLSVVPDLAACTEDNAIDVMRMPAMPANPVTCFLHAQAYVGATALGRELGANEAVKVICVRHRLDGQAASARSNGE